MNPFKRMMQRLGVTARLPKVSPQFSPGYAQAVPRDEIDHDVAVDRQHGARLAALLGGGPAAGIEVFD